MTNEETSQTNMDDNIELIAEQTLRIVTMTHVLVKAINDYPSDNLRQELINNVYDILSNNIPKSS